MLWKTLIGFMPLLLAGCSNHVWINNYALAPKAGEKIVAAKLDVQLTESGFFSSEPQIKHPDGICFQPVEQNMKYMNGSVCGSIRNWAWDRSYPATTMDGFMFTTLKPGEYRISSIWFKGGVSLQPREIRFEVPASGDGVSLGKLEFWVNWRKFEKKEQDAVHLKAFIDGEAVGLVKSVHSNLVMKEAIFDNSRAHEMILTKKF